MHRRTARTNRIALAVVGLILLAAGGYLIAGNLAAFGPGRAAESLYTASQARWLHAHNWIWIVAAAVVIVIGLLALRWLYIQPRLDRLRRLRVDADTTAGRTRLDAAVLTDAIEADIAGYPGVVRARAMLIGAADAPELVLRVSTHSGADLADVRDRVLAEAVPAARTAIDSSDLPALLQLQVSGRRAERVVR